MDFLFIFRIMINEYRIERKMKKKLSLSFEELKDYISKQKRLEKASGESKSFLICFPQTCVNRFRLIRIRVLLTFLSLASLVLMTCAFKNNVWWVTSLTVVAIWIETIYLCVWNEGRDFYW